MSTNKEYKTSKERGAFLCTSDLFIRFIKKALKFLGTPGKIFALIADAYGKSDSINSIDSITEKLKIQIFGLFALIKDFVSGHYKEIEVKDVTLIVAGIIYLVSPFDLVPDFIPGIGYFDDISILSWIISKLNEEIDTYLLWKNHKIKKLKRKKCTQNY